MELREYQLRAIEETRRRIGAGAKAVLINASVGAGKTVIAAYIVKSAVAKGKRVLFIAHRRELIEQCAAKLVDAGVLNHGIIMSGVRQLNADAPVQVASIQTLMRREHPHADLIIIDEAHRAGAGSYKTILANYPRAVVVGLSATPERLDGKGLSDLFDEMIVVESVPRLIELGFLVSPDCYIGDMASLEGVKAKRGDYDESALQEAMDKPKLIGDIFDNWKRIADGALTVAFASGVEHARHIAELFNERGVSAAHLSGDMPTAERQNIISRWRAGELRVVSNCMILCEGFDFPELECCILARPTKSVTLFIQSVGRVMRSAPGKTRAIVLDHAGCCESHGHPAMDRVWSLDSEQEKREKSDSKSLVHVCPACDMAFDVEPKLSLSEIQDKIGNEIASDKATALLREKDKSVRNLTPCPGCSSVACVVCLSVVKVKIEKQDIDGIAFTNSFECPTCHASYGDDVAHMLTESEPDALPETADGNLRLMSDEVPVGFKIKNDYKRLMMEAREKGHKRGAVFHRLVEQYGMDDVRAHLPRHKADWWRAAA